jgi:hypothetical protein
MASHAGAGARAQFLLARGDRVAIASPAAPDRLVQAAAEELEVHLAWLGLQPERAGRGSVQAPAIVLEPAPGQGLLDGLRGCSREGCLVRTVSPGVVTVAGLGGRGVLNGVYVLLEKVLGIRWLTPEATHVPDLARFDLSGLDLRYDPPFRYRALSCYKFEGRLDWPARQRINYFTDCFPRSFLEDARLSDGFFFAGRHHCHNVYELLALGYPEEERVPAGLVDVSAPRSKSEDYGLALARQIFAEHPEYFALVQGARRVSARGLNANYDAASQEDFSGQICLTHPEVARLLIRGIRRLVAADPGARFVAFSLRDNYDYCGCDSCRAAEARLGGMNNVYFDLANRVAAGIEPHCPDVLLGLLAYHGTQAPPHGVQLRPNIQIRYCPIRVSQYHAFDESDHNLVGGLNYETPPSMARPVEQLRRWRETCQHVMVWYYTLNLPTQHPHPNLRAHDRNLRLVRDLGAEGLYVEDISQRRNALQPIRAYVLARLLWDPDQDLDHLIEEFATLYYRDAAAGVLEYIRLLHDPASWDWERWPQKDGRSRWDVQEHEESWEWFGEKPDPAVYQTPHFFTLYGTRPPLKPAFFEAAARILNATEAAVGDDPVLRQRVREVRLPVLYAARKHLPPSHPLRPRLRPAPRSQRGGGVRTGARSSR